MKVPLKEYGKIFYSFIVESFQFIERVPVLILETRGFGKVSYSGYSGDIFFLSRFVDSLVPNSGGFHKRCRFFVSL